MFMAFCKLTDIRKFYSVNFLFLRVQCVYLCVWVFGMCIMCVQCPVGQKTAADYLKLELKMAVSHIVGAAGN